MKQEYDKECPVCSKLMEPCFNAQDGMKLRAWFCPGCLHTQAAVGRERLFEWSVESPITLAQYGMAMYDLYSISPPRRSK